MRSLDDTPTPTVDYAVLNAAYGAGVATLAYALRRGGARDDPPEGGELLALGAATFALARTIVHEKVEAWLRRPFVADTGHGGREPRGRGMRYALGELLTCTRCVGTWSALGLTALRTRHPAAGRTAIAVLAAAAINDFLQAAFADLGEAPGREIAR